MNQIDILTSRLRESELHLTDSKRLELQKTSELQMALLELAEVKRLLLQVKFDSVEAIIRELQNQERVSYEQRVELNRLTVQSSQQISKLSFDNERLKRELLEVSQKFIEQKDKADRLVASVNHLESEKLALSERISRLDDTIREYISQDIQESKEIREQRTEIQFDERLVQRQLEEIDILREPLNRAVEKLDRVSEKVR